MKVEESLEERPEGRRFRDWRAAAADGGEGSRESAAHETGLLIATLRPIRGDIQATAVMFAGRLHS